MKFPFDEGGVMWLRVEIGLHRHRKVYALARALECSRAEAVGILTALWSYAAEQHPSGDITGLDWLALNELFGLGGLGDAGDGLLSALTTTGWVDVPMDTITAEEPDGRQVIHDWYDYQGRLVENMERERDRGRRRRSTGRPPDVQPASTGRPPDVQESSVGYVTVRNETVRNDKKPSSPNGSGTAVVKAMDAKAVQARSAEVYAVIRKRTLTVTEHLRGHTEIIFAYWCAVTNRRASVMLDKKRANRITARLRESGNNLVEALHVVDGLLKDDHLMGRREDSQRKYDGIETIFKDRAMVERLSELGGYDGRCSHPFLDQLTEGE